MSNNDNITSYFVDAMTNQVIEDFMIDIEDDEIFYTPVSNYGITLSVK